MVTHWKTKSGRRVQIAKMHARHIRHAIGTLRDQGYVSIAERDAATEFGEGGFIPRANETIDALLEELDRRKPGVA